MLTGTRQFTLPNMTPQGTTSERLCLDAFPRQASSIAFDNYILLQVEYGGLSCGRELVVSRALNNVYPDLIASNPLSGLVEVECDVRSIKLPVADALPGTMPAAVDRVRIAASKKKCQLTKR